MKRLLPQDLSNLREQQGGVIVDVRSEEEFHAGHVEGAVHIPIAELAGRAGELPRDRPVVTYCNMFHPGSSRGGQAAARLLELGFDAGVLEGGFPAWQDAAQVDPQRDGE